MIRTRKRTTTSIRIRGRTGKRHREGKGQELGVLMGKGARITARISKKKGFELKTEGAVQKGIYEKGFRETNAQGFASATSPLLATPPCPPLGPLSTLFPAST